LGNGSSFLRTTLLLLAIAVLPAACRSDEELREEEQVQAFERQEQQEVAGPPQAEPEPVIRLLFTGDIILARCVYQQQALGDDFTSVFSDLAPLLRDADLTIGSLDSPLSDAGRPIGCTPTFNLLAPARSVEGLTHAGFDVLTVAGNHAKDCGGSAPSCDQALIDTVSNLDRAGIASVGGGANLAEARAPAVVSVKGVDFAFLGYDDIASYYHALDGAPGTAPLQEAYLTEDVAAAKAQADVVVVLPHWGVEYTATPTERQVRLARLALEAGATLVVGNHPHWVQASESSADGVIAYALGNFVFDQDWSLQTQQGAVLEATFQGARLVETRFMPVRIGESYRPALAERGEAAQILARIEEASRLLPQPVLTRFDR